MLLCLPQHQTQSLFERVTTACAIVLVRRQVLVAVPPGAFTGARGLDLGFSARAVVTAPVAMEAVGMVSGLERQKMHSPMVNGS